MTIRASGGPRDGEILRRRRSRDVTTLLTGEMRRKGAATSPSETGPQKDLSHATNSKLMNVAAR